MDHFFGFYYEPLTYFAFKLLEDTCLAEEIAAEAFVRLWNRREQLSGEGSIKSWLYTTVRNVALDHLRKAKRLRVSEAGLQTPETIEQSVLHRLIESETVQHVISVLDLLPPKCRQVFKMIYFGGQVLRGDRPGTGPLASHHTQPAYSGSAPDKGKDGVFLLVFVLTACPAPLIGSNTRFTL